MFWLIEDKRTEDRVFSIYIKIVIWKIDINLGGGATPIGLNWSATQVLFAAYAYVLSALRQAFIYFWLACRPIMSIQLRWE